MRSTGRWPLYLDKPVYKQTKLIEFGNCGYFYKVRQENNNSVLTRTRTR